MTTLVVIVVSLFLQMFDPFSGDLGRKRPPIRDRPVADNLMVGE
jgi:hypothetical protein